MEDIEELKLYHVYIEYMKYEYILLNKYDEYKALKEDIQRVMTKGMELVIKIYKERTYSIKMRHLNDFDANLKILKVYARISTKLKIINNRNYKASCGKLSVLNNMMFGIMKSCQRQ